MADISPEQLFKLTEKLLHERAVDFREYKPTTLSRRIQRRLEATKCADIECYLEYLDQRPDEYAKLIDSLLINVTEFFRDPEAWEAIRTEVLPQIATEKRPGDQIRVWCAGCATGQEPYTVAMILSELLGSRIGEYDVRIYATDIDDNALSLARRAEYTDEAVQSVPPELLQKYFTKNGRWAVNRDLRKLVIFGRHNLVMDPPISHVDLVICRNVLIYMSVDLQNRILSKFHYALNTHGYLFLGKAESLLTTSRLFASINDKWRIFRKQSVIGSTNGRGAAEQQAIGQAVATGSAEYQLVSLFNEGVLRHMSSGVIGIDGNGIVQVMNPAAETIWGIQSSDLLGKPILEVNAPAPLRDIIPKFQQVRSQRTEMRIDAIDLSAERNKPFYVSVTLTPMFDIRGNALGVIIVAENITTQVRLRNDLEGVNEQIQAANEELETTNEELQSTNEELETTNEELQSTNEELETTNEELQSTNEELSTMNDELAVRTTELNTLGLYYRSIADSLIIPVVVLNEDNMVTTWNPAAEQFYGIKASDAMNRNFFELTLPVRVARTRDKLHTVRETRKPYRSEPIEYNTLTGETRRVLVEYQPLIDEQQNYRGAISVVRDADMRALEPSAPSQ